MMSPMSVPPPPAGGPAKASSAVWKGLLLIPPLLLAVTGAMQVVLSKAGPLAPWRGGGFGLFSTVDKLENRILLAWIETPAGDDPVPPGDTYDVRNALAFPSQDRLLRAATDIAARHADTDAVAVRVEVWKRTYDPATSECHRVPVGRRRVPLAR
jgi:hypothetical protein